MTIKVEIKQDEDPVDPRKDSDHLGRMYCWHSRYDLGDEKPKGYTPEDFLKEYTDENSLILPLVLLDHSGITIKVGREFSCDPGEWEFSCDPGGWDTSKVGWIVVTNEGIEKEYGKKIPDAREKAREVLRGEVEVYDQYLTGDIYGYVVTKTTACKHCKEKKEEVINSCWGFYGRDVETNGMLENIDKKYRKALTQAK